MLQGRNFFENFMTYVAHLLTCKLKFVIAYLIFFCMSVFPLYFDVSQQMIFLENQTKNNIAWPLEIVSVNFSSSSPLEFVDLLDSHWKLLLSLIRISKFSVGGHLIRMWRFLCFAFYHNTASSYVFNLTFENLKAQLFLCMSDSFVQTSVTTSVAFEKL